MIDIFVRNNFMQKYGRELGDDMILKSFDDDMKISIIDLS